MKLNSGLLLLIFVLPLFVGLEDSAVWDSNEAFYAQTPQEMLDRADWLIPHFNGKPRLNKPPLSYWVVGIFYKAFGVSLFWERFVMALAGLGSVLAVYWMGITLFQRPVALWAAGIFATTFRFLVLSRRLLIDVLVLFFLLMAIAFFLSWLKKERKASFLLAAAFLGLGALTKGPVALLPVFFLFIYLLFSGEIRKLFSAPLLASAILFLLIVTPWYLVLGFYNGWESVTDFFLKENLGRFTHLDYGPDRGYFYYVGVFLADFFPWSLLFLGGVYWYFRGGKKRKVEERRAFRLLGLWIAVWVLVFSFSRNKQEYYILPVYPAAALWIACYLRQSIAPKVLRWVAGLLAALLAAVLFLAAGSLFSETLFFWIPPIALLAASYLLIRGQWTPAIVSLSLFYALSFQIYLKPLDEYRPVHHFAKVIQERESVRRRTFEAGYLNLASPSLSFYLNKPVLEFYDLGEAVSYLNDADYRVYLLVREGDFDPLQAQTDDDLEIVDARQKLATQGKTIAKHILNGRLSARSWTEPVFLVSNSASRQTSRP
jgi:4-amino-4-deoxy-L-arabinose transferase-like glycosyltransferase